MNEIINSPICDTTIYSISHPNFHLLKEKKLNIFSHLFILSHSAIEIIDFTKGYAIENDRGVDAKR